MTKKKQVNYACFKKLTSDRIRKLTINYLNIFSKM